jgi:hypothetical protein
MCFDLDHGRFDSRRFYRWATVCSR